MEDSLRDHDMMRIGLMVAALVVSATTALLATENYLGADTAWNTPASWSEGHMPMGTESANIMTDVTVTGSSGIGATDYTGKSNTNLL